MFTDNLYNTVLIAPATQGADFLNIVSGYASAAFVARHIEDILVSCPSIRVRLFVGMFPQIGNLNVNHPAFKRLSITDFPLRFECRYNSNQKLVHSKVYCWYKNGSPFHGFTGSANYSKNGFDGSQGEVLCKIDANDADKYFQSLWEIGLDCREAEADRLVFEAIENYKRQRASQATIIHTTNQLIPIPENDYIGLPYKDLPLVKKNGEVPDVSGLNWGHRGKRSRDEAYIHIPAPIARTSFFPPLKMPFTILTDDDKSLICVRAQTKTKGGTVGYAIETTNNNSQLGLYFRGRLNLASGQFVTRQDLDKHGRCSVRFYKIDEETYYLDFAKIYPQSQT